MLVDYSSSSEEDDELNASNEPKKKQNGASKTTAEGKEEKPALVPLPSVPTDIVNMFGSDKPQTRDDPDKHGGRVRTFAHERGNWATHIYIPYQRQTEFSEFMSGLLECLDDNWHSVEDFHISLSRTFPIRYHWIDGLTTSLRKGLRSRRFPITFCGYKIYTNDEGTRSFLGVNVQAGLQQLVNLVGQVDESLQEFRLPVYYSDPEFHLSLVWCLGDVRQTISHSRRCKLEEYLSSTLDDLSFTAEFALMKTGNKVFNLPFT